MSVSLAVIATLAVALAAHTGGHALVGRLAGSRSGGWRTWVPVIGCRHRLAAGGGGAARLAQLAGASLASYLAAATAAAVLYLGVGLESDHRRYRVDEVMPGSAAAGTLEAGDVLLELDGAPLYYLRHGVPQRHLAERVQESGSASLELLVERAGQRRAVTLTPTLIDSSYRLGITLEFVDYRGDREELTTGQQVALSLVHPVAQLASLLATDLDDPVGGELSGPIGIIRPMPELDQPLRRAARTAANIAAGLWLLLTLLDVGFAIALRGSRPGGGKGQPTG